MSTAVLVPVSEYLDHTYDPDCEYLEGILQERNVGEISHGEAQTSLVVYVRTEIPSVWAVVEVRVQVKSQRFRIPDVTIVRGPKPSGRIITSPPEIAVEVLSPTIAPPTSKTKSTITSPSAFRASGLFAPTPSVHGSIPTKAPAKPKTAYSRRPIAQCLRRRRHPFVRHLPG